MADQLKQWKELAAQLRVDSIRCTTAAGSGHPTSSMSAADLMAVLLAKYLRFDWSQPHFPNNDRLIFSKGHACPVLYAMFKAAGAITDQELMSLRKFGSRLQGHPNPHVLPYVDVATGSLGQGLPIGVGMALNGKYLDKLPYRVYVVLGDSECAEGSIWEAFDKASYYKLGNLTAILDMNRLGQRGETDLGWDSAAYAARARAFGWNAVELDGHDLTAIDEAYAAADAEKDPPTLLVARTVKGSGVALVANKDGWHGKALSPEQAEKAIAELGGERKIVVPSPKPANEVADKPTASSALEWPSYALGGTEATRKAYGDAITALGARRPDVVALDAEVSNSTYADEFKKAHPDRFFEMFIAEQQLLGAAVGLGVLGKRPFASTFAAFFTRAHDQIRMASLSNASIRLSGSHAGCSIGADGPSQMALEDLALMRAVHGSTVLYPCDANQTAALVEQMADLAGISYIRTTREKTPILYGPGESFPVGAARLVKRGNHDRAAVIAAGVTVHEAVKAYDKLRAAFIREGGYATPSLWLSEGYDFVRANGIEAPMYVALDDGELRVFSLGGSRPAYDTEPVTHVRYYEADAIARFLGARLPTEAEWELAATQTAVEGNFAESGSSRVTFAPRTGTFGIRRRASRCPGSVSPARVM